ncbi:MAG: DUF2059 domain-containing protein [Rhodothermaceae bacterium]|nr:DUF2059 domain-containing protein [Rhodothermaceae bacterium]
MRSIKIILLLALFSLTFTSLHAQGTESHRSAVNDLLETVEFEKNMLETIENMLELQIRQNPDLIAFRDVMSSFFIKHLTSDEVKERYVDIYLESFTEEEIVELNSFFKTDLGRKYYIESQNLSLKGMQIGEEVVQQNMGEFQQLMMERAQELEGAIDQQ